MREKQRKNTVFFSFFLLFLVLLSSVVNTSAANEPISITVHYSNVTDELQTITVDFCDDWLLQPADVYNHKLMQASFAMAVAAFRSKIYDLSQLDHDILDFFAQAGFTEPRSDDYNKPTGINTIGTAIAHKKVGGDTLIAVAISGNNYQNEWLSNLTIDNDNRAAGFNSAADKVTSRLEKYIRDHQLNGPLHLWVAGYSRAAAVSNLFAADAVDSRKFAGVYAYTFATPRTTREADPERYHSIFNLINPEDVVPMIPFPEWGYQRYGTDLFLPSVATDSGYNDKYFEAAREAGADSENLPVFKPRMQRELHTVLDYIAYFVNSSDFYTREVQDLLLNFYRNRDPKELFNEIRERIRFKNIWESISRRNSYFRHQIYEFYNFLDFNANISIRSYITHQMGSDEDYWVNSLSLQENLAFGHYDKTYRFWLFSTDDPEKLFTRDPKYIHYTILGDVDVEILDSRGDLIEQFDREGWFTTDLDNTLNPDFHGKMSDSIIYAERTGNQTMLVLPADQTYTVYIRSNIEQDIKVSTVEFSAEKLKADVLYIYLDHYDKNEGYPETIDPDVEPLLTSEILEKEYGVKTTRPWSKDIKYSPTAVMRLENGGILIEKSLAVMILAHIVINQMIALVIFLVIRLSTGIILLFRKKVLGHKIPKNPDPLELPEAKKSAALPLQ